MAEHETIAGHHDRHGRAQHLPEGQVSALPVTGRLLVNDAYSYREARLDGLGIAQFLHLGIQPLLDAGKLVELFPDWPDEYFPFWVYYPSRQFVPAKLKALLSFLQTLPTEEKAIR